MSIYLLYKKINANGDKHTHRPVLKLIWILANTFKAFFSGTSQRCHSNCLNLVNSFNLLWNSTSRMKTIFLHWYTWRPTNPHCRQTTQPWCGIDYKLFIRWRRWKSLLHLNNPASHSHMYIYLILPPRNFKCKITTMDSPATFTHHHGKCFIRMKLINISVKCERSSSFNQIGAD